MGPVPAALERNFLEVTVVDNVFLFGDRYECLVRYHYIISVPDKH